MIQAHTVIADAQLNCETTLQTALRENKELQAYKECLVQRPLGIAHFRTTTCVLMTLQRLVGIVTNTSSAADGPDRLLGVHVMQAAMSTRLWSVG